ncbi:MAG: hypothetical protein ACT4PT_11935 [Methanobacteriota archaeon]
MPEKRLKKRGKKKADEKVSFDVGETFSPADAREEDFDLDLDSAIYQGKKGQAGTRTKSSG